jgi:hypothetical protein
MRAEFGPLTMYRDPPGDETRRRHHKHRDQTATHSDTSRLDCLDCDAVGSDGRAPTMRHRGECPIGRGLSDAMDDDRAFFADHPDATTRERAITWAERAQQAALGAPPELLDGARVIIRSVAPGVRVRAIVPGRRGT